MPSSFRAPGFPLVHFQFLGKCLQQQLLALQGARLQAICTQMTAVAVMHGSQTKLIQECTLIHTRAQ